MKELSIEEKAKRYDEAIEKGKQIQNTPYTAHWDIMKEVTEHLFPELKESEDEKTIHWIRKELEAKYVVDNIVNNVMADKAFAWLVKQSKASKVEEAMREVEEKATAFTEAHKGETSEEILAQMRGEKPDDKIGPKFKVGDKIISTITNLPYYITEVCNGHYLTDVGCVIMFNAQDNFELSKQNSAWSEEDENHIKHILNVLEDKQNEQMERGFNNLNSDVSWLKSIKYRYTWRPSDEQMENLSRAFNGGTYQTSLLMELYQDLNKLKG